MKDFDGLEYTRNAILEELALIERHARDGSAVDAGCACIEEKHLLNLAGLASEGVTLATNQKEREYYMGLANLARELRREVLDGDFKRAPSHGKAAASFAHCEKEVAKCVAKGKSEAECRASVSCP